MNDTKQAIVKEAEFMATLVDDLLKEGRIDEAREMVQGEIQTLTYERVNELLRCKNLLCKIERTANNFQRALEIHIDAYPLANLSDNHTLKARFHIGLATTYDELGYSDKALIEYEAARFHYNEAGCREEVGLIENSLAVVLSKLGRTEEAFIHLEAARTHIDEPVVLAQIGVTEVEVYLRTGESDKAIHLMLECVRTYEKYGAKHLFDKSMDTLIKAATDYKVSR